MEDPLDKCCLFLSSSELLSLGFFDEFSPSFPPGGVPDEFKYTVLSVFQPIGSSYLILVLRYDLSPSLMWEGILCCVVSPILNSDFLFNLEGIL